MNFQTNLTPSNPVILNLFQDPFLRTPGTCVGALVGELGVYGVSTAPGARWILKQVQDDDNGYGIA